MDSAVLSTGQMSGAIDRNNGRARFRRRRTFWCVTINFSHSFTSLTMIHIPRVRLLRTRDSPRCTPSSATSIDANGRRFTKCEFCRFQHPRPSTRIFRSHTPCTSSNLHSVDAIQFHRPFHAFIGLYDDFQKIAPSGEMVTSPTFDFHFPTNQRSSRLKFPYTVRHDTTPHARQSSEVGGKDYDFVILTKSLSLPPVPLEIGDCGRSRRWSEAKRWI